MAGEKHQDRIPTKLQTKSSWASSMRNGKVGGFRVGPLRFRPPRSLRLFAFPLFLLSAAFLTVTACWQIRGVGFRQPLREFRDPRRLRGVPGEIRVLERVGGFVVDVPRFHRRSGCSASLRCGRCDLNPCVVIAGCSQAAFGSLSSGKPHVVAFEMRGTPAGRSAHRASMIFT